MNYNYVNLAGNIGKIDIKETKKGKPFAVVTLATNKTHLDKEGKKTQATEWHTLNIYGKKVEYAKRLVKGNTITVIGELMYSTWEAEDGKHRKSAFILVNSFNKIESLFEKAEDEVDAESDEDEAF